MPTILVTGAGGYIGSVTSSLLLEQGHTVVTLDNYIRGYHEPLKYLNHKYGEKIRIFRSDLVVDGGKHVFDANPDIEAVIHFAALLDVGESWKIPQKYFTNNVAGTQMLLEQCVDHDVQKVIFSSSCVVYGNAQYTPIDENHPIVDPASPYGMTKLLNERLLTDYRTLNLVKSIFLRYFNVCGATDDGALGDSKKPSFHLVQNAVRGALGLDQFALNYATVNTPDGSPIRDYVNVVDLADAHIRALAHLMKENTNETFNLGTGTGSSVLEIVQEVKRLTGKDFPVNENPERRQGEADKMIADISKARSVLGWEPKHNLSQSVESLIKWYTAHPNGWAT
ncbi:UDP-glucose 4-epimerase GalE [Candidatus Woesebacteria bacterium]|nr:UDP-glucose 4-epimerase GalE [Candidatus Woesebacteria bacterium]